MERKMIDIRYCIDIDNTICECPFPMPYKEATPITKRIESLNRIYDEGYYIILATARTERYREITERQLKEWGVKYDELHFGKPIADLYVDDKAMTDQRFFNMVAPIAEGGTNYA
jgi:hypothetical protein